MSEEPEFNLDNFSFKQENLTSTPTVPNRPPTSPAPYKIAFIDEWPGPDDFSSGIAFTGRAGNVLTSVLTQLGVLSSACFYGYAYNAEVKFPKRYPDWHSLQANRYRNTLQKELKTFNPHITVIMGDAAAKGLGIMNKTSAAWRGSVFKCDDLDSPLLGRKCMIVQHPLIIMKQYAFMPLFLMDLSRAKQQGTSKELPDRRKDYAVDLSCGVVVQKLQRLREEQKLVSMDIEGYVNNVTCISFTNTEGEAFIVDLLSCSLTEEKILLKAISELCYDKLVPKVLQNSLYDSFVLAYTYNIVIRNIQHDTMLSGWEIYPELPKGLGTLTSIWTTHPYYKSDRKINDKLTHHRYCCTDSDVTLEISKAHQKNLTGPALEHYNFNLSMLAPLLFAQLKGMKYDGDKAKQMLGQVSVRMDEIQNRLNNSTFDGRELNINSPKQMQNFLYKEKSLPTQFKMLAGRVTNTPTTDVKALLKLNRKFEELYLSDILLMRKLEKQRQGLNMTHDTDGRVRCSYNVVGTDTGRLSCSKSAHGTGTNLTTIPKAFRSLYLADEGHYFFQCDLAGADGWTVAAHSKALGDPTMIDDYNFGLKPAKIIALLYNHGPEVNKWSRDKILEESKAIGDGWLYFSSKQVQHGGNYGLGVRAMSENIMLQSYKRNNEMILVTPSTCQQLKDLYLIHRYPGVIQWQNRIKYQFSNARGYPEMSSASGHTRRFLGRKKENSTHQAAYSQEPQINTTYATNLAIVNMWNDPENRIKEAEEFSHGFKYTTLDGSIHTTTKNHEFKSVGGLLIEPLHQVHDAACGQFPKDLQVWACKKIRSYFDNELNIAGTKMVIPFDGEYGRSWGEMDKPL